MLKNLGSKPALCLSACQAAALFWSHEWCKFARILALSAQPSFSTVIRSTSGTASCILCSALKYFFSTADSQCSATWRVRLQHGDQRNRPLLQLWPCWAQETRSPDACTPCTSAKWSAPDMSSPQANSNPATSCKIGQIYRLFLLKDMNDKVTNECQPFNNSGIPADSLKAFVCSQQPSLWLICPSSRCFPTHKHTLTSLICSCAHSRLV